MEKKKRESERERARLQGSEKKKRERVSAVFCEWCEERERCMQEASGRREENKKNCDEFIAYCVQQRQPDDLEGGDRL